jgi:hypothetical protein
MPQNAALIGLAVCPAPADLTGLEVLKQLAPTYGTLICYPRLLHPPRQPLASTMDLLLPLQIVAHSMIWMLSRQVPRV